jgi:DNA-directed RNA polymerase specialized sigma24 family protein
MSVLKMSKLPEEFNETVERVIGWLAHKYCFGLYEIEDMSQEIWYACLSSIERWDGKRSLYNFLLTCSKNALQNIKRREFFRHECPCGLCNFKEDGQTGHDDKKYCAVYIKWYQNNSRKSNLASPQRLGNKELIMEDNMEEEAVDREDFLELIDKELPVSLRSTYLKMKSGVSVPNREKQKVLEFLKKYTDA